MTERLVHETQFACVKCGVLPYDRLMFGSAICERCRVATTPAATMTPLVTSFDVFRGAATVTLTVPSEALRYVNEDGRTAIKEWLERVKSILHQRMIIVDPPLVQWKH